MLRPTTCTFSRSEPLKVVRTWSVSKMCSRQQRRALFRHRNFPKVVRIFRVLTKLSSKCASRHHGVHFFESQLSRSDPALVCLILTWKCASRHNGMQFSSLSSQLTPLWRAYFSSGPQIMEKLNVSRLSSFSRNAPSFF